jgi:hypothetical protein
MVIPGLGSRKAWGNTMFTLSFDRHSLIQKTKNNCVQRRYIVLPSDCDGVESRKTFVLYTTCLIHTLLSRNLLMLKCAYNSYFEIRN